MAPLFYINSLPREGGERSLSDLTAQPCSHEQSVSFLMRHWRVAGSTSPAVAEPLIATRRSRVFFLWFVSFLRQKRNEHPQAKQQLLPFLTGHYQYLVL
jgi:hypothetical protein